MLTRVMQLAPDFFFPGGWGPDGRTSQATGAIALVHIAMVSKGDRVSGRGGARVEPGWSQGGARSEDEGSIGGNMTLENLASCPILPPKQEEWCKGAVEAREPLRHAIC